MGFCTAINCMDGRTQLPVIKYLQKRFNVEHVDSINEPGPNLILTEEKDTALIRSIFDRLKISIENHNSVGVAIVGHHDCAGNPAPKEEQIEQVRKAIQTVRKEYERIEIIGLWVDENWEVREVY